MSGKCKGHKCPKCGNEWETDYKSEQCMGARGDCPACSNGKPASQIMWRYTDPLIQLVYEAKKGGEK